MAVLINGNGNEAIYAQQDADWFASIMGNQTAITAIGSKFAATLEDANTIGVADGVIITQEGRRIQLDVNELDLFDIPAGGQGQTNYYIIGYHLVTGDLSEQYCETFVRLMDNDTDTIPEDTFRAGADEVFVSLYRVTQVNLAITDMELLLPEITTVAQISQHLTEKVGGEISSYTSVENIAYDETNNKLMLKVEGADTPIPFSSGLSFILYSFYSYQNTWVLCYTKRNDGLYDLTRYNDRNMDNEYAKVTWTSGSTTPTTQVKKPCKYIKDNVVYALEAGQSVAGAYVFQFE